jgi:hypothetical protein
MVRGIIDRGEVSETFALADLGGLDLTYSVQLYGWHGSVVDNIQLNGIC